MRLKNSNNGKAPISYAARLRRAMDTATNATGERLTIREIARRTGYSYEHCRKACNGETHYISDPFNEKLCRVVGLDRGEMWQVAIQEKLCARYGPIRPTHRSTRFDELWRQLSGRDHQVLEGIAEVLVEHRRR